MRLFVVILYIFLLFLYFICGLIETEIAKMIKKTYKSLLMCTYIRKRVIRKIDMQKNKTTRRATFFSHDSCTE
jgi:hypothetical protein